jgi:hypothetical protein
MADDPTAISPSEDFSQTVAHVLLACEELRRPITETPDEPTVLQAVERIRSWQADWDHVILPSLERLERHTDDASSSSWPQGGVAADLLAHCLQKAITVAQQVLTSATRMPEPTQEDLDTHEVIDASLDQIQRDIQGGVARLMEVNVLLWVRYRTRFGNLAEEQILNDLQLIELYVTYQKDVFRRRVTPAVARLKRARTSGNLGAQIPPVSLLPGARVQQHEDDDDDEATQASETVPVVEQHHAPVMANILGQALTLIHPLWSWFVQLPPPPSETQGPSDKDPLVSVIQAVCVESIQILDNQAQTIVKTLSDWFWVDQPQAETWMQQSIDSTTVHLDPTELGRLDGLVEEMAFGCKVQARYSAFLESTSLAGLQSTIASQLLPEWTWKYAALERFLATQQWQSALLLAAPVHIVIGTDIQVPSVVEDAQYLSTRALERAASTQSAQAMGTVAHALAHDVWSTEVNDNEAGAGVYVALLEQRASWKESSTHRNEKGGEEGIQPKTQEKSGFASALLDALDEDLSPDSPQPYTTSPEKGHRTPTAPTSGNFLRSFVGRNDESLQQMELEMQFCVLNGIHAASGACRSLVSLLDSLLLPLGDEEEEDVAATNAITPSRGDSKASSMVQLAREDLDRYASAYESLLAIKIKQSLVEWCGYRPDSTAPDLRRRRNNLCLLQLETFFTDENYELDSHSIQELEGDERLERNLFGPLKESSYLVQLADRIEPQVLHKVGEQLASAIVNLILNSLWNGQKRVTEWGSLLLSKEVRMLKEYIHKTVSPMVEESTLPPLAPELLDIWERLSQVVAVLQLEKPSDWIIYATSSVLSATDLQRTLSLRTDFSADAIQSVVRTVTQTTNKG